jgi:hypothetical protein
MNQFIAKDGCRLLWGCPPPTVPTAAGNNDVAVPDGANVLIL